MSPNKQMLELKENTPKQYILLFFFVKQNHAIHNWDLLLVWQNSKF